MTIPQPMRAVLIKCARLMLDADVHYDDYHAVDLSLLGTAIRETPEAVVSDLYELVKNSTYSGKVVRLAAPDLFVNQYDDEPCIYMVLCSYNHPHNVDGIVDQPSGNVRFITMRPIPGGLNIKEPTYSADQMRRRRNANLRNSQPAQEYATRAEMMLYETLTIQLRTRLEELATNANRPQPLAEFNQEIGSGVVTSLEALLYYAHQCGLDLEASLTSTYPMPRRRNAVTVTRAGAGSGY